MNTRKVMWMAPQVSIATQRDARHAKPTPPAPAATAAAAVSGSEWQHSDKPRLLPSNCPPPPAGCAGGHGVQPVCRRPGQLSQQQHQRGSRHSSGRTRADAWPGGGGHVGASEAVQGVAARSGMAECGMPSVCKLAAVPRVAWQCLHSLPPGAVLGGPPQNVFFVRLLAGERNHFTALHSCQPALPA